MKHAMFVLARAFTASLLALTTWGPARATQSDPFSFSYAPGQVFHYHDAGGHVSSMGGRQEATADFTVTVLSADGSSFHANETMVARGRTVVTPMTISANGVWTRDSDRAILYNFVSFDPSTLCRSEAPIQPGASWSCDVSGTWLRGAGSETITLLSMNGAAATIRVQGSAAPQHTTKVEPSNNATIALDTRLTWTEIVTFVGGRRTKTSIEEHHVTIIAGSTQRVISDVHDTYTSM